MSLRRQTLAISECYQRSGIFRLACHTAAWLVSAHILARDFSQPSSDNKLSVGAEADSAHEYLLKQYLLTGKTDKLNLELCSFGPLDSRMDLTLRVSFRPSSHLVHPVKSTLPHAEKRPALCDGQSVTQRRRHNRSS